MRLRWLVSARVDLARIVDEIAIDNPVAADAFEMRLFKMVAHLTTFPDAGRTGRVARTRELIVPEHPYIVSGVPTPPSLVEADRPGSRRMAGSI